MSADNYFCCIRKMVAALNTVNGLEALKMERDFLSNFEKKKPTS
jgi:hypothetical protein